MPTNYFVPMATGAGANVRTDADWDGSAVQSTGVQTGIVASKDMNKAWRQGTSMASVMGQMIVNRALLDATDNGDITALLSNFERGVAALMDSARAAVDTSGSANVITASVSPVPPSLTNIIVWITVANTNTAATTLTLNTGFGPKSVLRRNGSAVQPGDLVAGITYPFRYDGSAFRSVSVLRSEVADFIGGSGGYTPIFAARTYYVNAATGSDTNDGLTTGTALQTINAAIAKVGSLNLNGNTVTIQLADGTYAACSFNAAFFGNGTVVLQGNLSTPANVKIQTTTGNAVLVRNGAVLSVQGFQPLTQDSGYGCLIAQFGGQINIIGAMDFPACTAAYHIAGLDNGSVRIGSNYTISGAGGATHYYASNYGRVFKYLEVAQAVSVLNPITFTTAFAQAAAGEMFLPTLTFSGAATSGPRYSAVEGGIIRTASGANATYFPGNSAGSKDSTSVYS